jgi:REP element-mobilizing transposase RayT
MLLYRRHPPHYTIVDLDNRSNILLLTVCTKNREPLLAESWVWELLVNAWGPTDHWKVGKYVVLPDHLHLFCSPMMEGRLSLARWVASWKSLISRNWRFPRQGPLWQRSFWDRQIRSGESSRGTGCSLLDRNCRRIRLPLQERQIVSIFSAQ